MESVGNTVGQVDRGDGLEARGVEDGQVAAVGGGVVDESHEHSVVLGGVRCVGDEDEFTDALVGAQPASDGLAAGRVVFEHRVAVVPPVLEVCIAYP